MKTMPSHSALARLTAAACCVLLSNLSTRVRADNSLLDVASEPATRLDAVEVHSDRARDEDYKADRLRTATKTDTPLQDIPQSITVVTAEQIADQQLGSLEDVARYVPGVVSHQGENNRDQLILRGQSTSADFFLNGVRDDVQYYRDLYNLDRVEVLRGPNAMIFGRGGGGGVINRATKEADFTPLRELSLVTGSFRTARGTLDLDEPLGRTVAVRVNGVVEDSHTFRRFVGRRRRGVNPTLTLLPAPETRVTLSYEYFHDRRTADRGITSFQGRPADVPVETYYGDPTASHVNANVNLATATVEHRVGSLAIHERLVFGDYDRGYQNFVPGAATADKQQVALTAYNNATRRQNVFSQTDLTDTLQTGFVRHTLLAGMELGRQLTDNFKNTGYFNNATTSFLVPFANPTTAVPVTWRQSATDANNHLKTNLAAVYGQDQVEFSRHWQALLGLRFDSFDLQYRNRRNGDYLGRRDSLLSPRGGLIYKPSAKLSLYGSYGVSYLPSSGDQFSSLTTVTQQVKPEKFTNYEVGAKWDLPRNVSLTAAAYELYRTNTRATDPNDPTRILQTGRQRTRGVEAALEGRLSSRWTAIVAYGLQDARITSATTAAKAGAVVAQVPRQTASLWSKYQLTARFSAGVGTIYRSAMFAAIDNTVTLPGYATLDAALFYSLNDHWRLQVNAENVLNHRYYLNADSNTNISPGSPLAIRVGLTTRY